MDVKFRYCKLTLNVYLMSMKMELDVLTYFLRRNFT